MNEEKNKQRKDQNYNFLSEDVFSGSKGKGKRSKAGTVALVLCLAVLFGLLASISYAVSNGVIEYIARKQEDASRKNVSISNSNDEDKDENENVILTDISRLAKSVEGSVVVVQTKVESSDGIFSGKLKSGNEYCGFVIGDDSNNFYIMTPYSLISEAAQLYVRFGEDAVIQARVVGQNQLLDLAILIVNYSSVFMEDLSNVKVLKFAQPGTVTVGTPVMAIGSPNGIIGSIDYGIITSEKNSSPLPDVNLNISTTNMHYYNNASGVIVNMNGEICGLITRIYSDIQVSTFISTDNIITQLEHMINKSFMLYTGAVCENVSAEVLENAGCTNGIYVNKVEEGSPADKAGLRSGDIIVSSGDTLIKTVDDYSALLYSVGYGSKFDLTVKRSGSDKTITITVGNQ